MQIKIGFSSSNEDIQLPVHYNHFTGFYYNNIDRDLSVFYMTMGMQVMAGCLNYLPFLGY